MGPGWGAQLPAVLLRLPAVGLLLDIGMGEFVVPSDCDGAVVSRMCYM